MMLDPQIETAPWAEQKALDDQKYREQIAYLFAHSKFYRDKLTEAGFDSPENVGGLDNIQALPFTQKDDLRATRSDDEPIGTHLAAPMEKVVRVFSTSGTTGDPSYIPVTAQDLRNWVRTSSRSYAAAGVSAGERIVTSYNAGPFAAGAALEAFNNLGLCHIPVGTGNTERLMKAVRLLKPHALAMTPSYALYLAEWAAERGFDTRGSSVQRIMVAGEPGGGEPAVRQRIEAAWGAQVTEAMGVGDISISIWGECEEQSGMHFCGRGFLHFELVDPETGEPVEVKDGARGELVLTHLTHEAAPLLRFRTRDHVEIWTSPCKCGRTAPRVRCIGRTDDMLIVRGVNVFPSAVRQVVNDFEPEVSGRIAIRPKDPGVKQAPPLPVAVELAKGVQPSAELAARIKKRIRDTLLVTTDVQLVDWEALPRTDYKSKLIQR